MIFENMKNMFSKIRKQTMSQCCFENDDIAFRENESLIDIKFAASWVQADAQPPKWGSRPTGGAGWGGGW